MRLFFKSRQIIERVGIKEPAATDQTHTNEPKMPIAPATHKSVEPAIINTQRPRLAVGLIPDKPVGLANSRNPLPNRHC